MGRWERTHHDTAVPDAARHDVGDGGDPRPLPPVHLDIDGHFAPPDEPDDARSWRRWFGLGVALVIAAVAGVIVTNARHEAADRTRVELIGGEATASFAGWVDPGTPTWETEFMVFNAGVRTVDIVEIGLDGWRRPQDARPADPVAARPGRWTTVHARLIPECTDDTSSEPVAFAAAAVVRSGGRESDVALEFAPNASWFRDFWAMTCAPTDAPYPEVGIGAVEVLPHENAPDQLRTRMFVALADGGGQATLVRVWSHVRGFSSQASGLPVELRGGELGEVDLTWQVESCESVDLLETARLSLHLTNGDDNSGARLRHAPVPDQVLIELGKLFAQVCGL